MPGGRKVVWTPEAIAEAFPYICERIAKGKSLATICDEDHISVATVRKWINEDPELEKRYVRAREDQADYYADEIMKIADEATDANLGRLRVEARKWVAAKLKPKTYGERLQLDADVRIELTDDQLESRLAQLLGKKGADQPSGREGAKGEAA